MVFKPEFRGDLIRLPGRNIKPELLDDILTTLLKQAPAPGKFFALVEWKDGVQNWTDNPDDLFVLAEPTNICQIQLHLTYGPTDQLSGPLVGGRIRARGQIAIARAEDIEGQVKRNGGIRPSADTYLAVSVFCLAALIGLGYAPRSAARVYFAWSLLALAPLSLLGWGYQERLERRYGKYLWIRTRSAWREPAVVLGVLAVVAAIAQLFR